MRSTDEIMNVFIANFELGFRMKKNQLNFAGAFVAVAVVAPEIRKALDWAEKALLEDGYQIRIIEGIQLYDPDEVLDEELERIAQEASNTGAITYGQFYTYEKSELQ